MALEKTTTNDKIEVISHGDWSSIQVRAATVITENGDKIGETFHRHVLMPDADLSAEDADVQAIAGTVFTDAAKAAYAARPAE